MALGPNLAKLVFLTGLSLLLTSAVSCERSVDFGAREFSIDDVRICKREDCGYARLKGYLGWGDSGVHLYETKAHADYRLVSDSLWIPNSQKAQEIIQECGEGYVYLYVKIGHTSDSGVHVTETGDVLKIVKSNIDGILSYEQCYE